MGKILLKVLLFFLCLNLTVGLLGCNQETPVRTEEEQQEVIDRIHERAENIKAMDSTQESNTFDDFMKENKITLLVKDVQFDMSNNINKSFAIKGTAKLSKYYNYGFDNSIEKEYFVIKVRPSDGNYSDGWYIYCNRKTFNEFFDDLKKHSELSIMVKCVIPESNYKAGQDNMALLQLINW